jgi:hypothetical protein
MISRGSADRLARIPRVRYPRLLHELAGELHVVGDDGSANFDRLDSTRADQAQSKVMTLHVDEGMLGEITRLAQPGVVLQVAR